MNGNNENNYTEEYIRNRHGGQKYAKNAFNDEIYKTSNNLWGHYARNRYGDQVYAKDRHGNEIYFFLNDIPIPALDWKGNIHYAKNNEGFEYYPEKNGKIFVFMSKEGIVSYAKKPVIYFNTVLQSEFYPKINNKEIVYGVYAINEFNFEYYPKDAEGNEYLDFQYILFEETIIYPVSKTGEPIYRKNEEQDEYYEVNYFHKVDEIPFYSNESKIYALLIQKVPGEPRYALKHSGDVVFPKDKNENEYYIKLSDNSVYLTGLKTYAKNNEGKEIYPYDGTKEQTLGKYALDKNNKPYYPLDEFGIEYTIITNDGNRFPLGNPIDHKGYEIINDHKSVSIDKIQGYLKHRPSEFVTTIKSSRTPRETISNYTLVHVDWNKKEMSHWTVMSVLIAIMSWIFKWVMQSFVLNKS